MFRSTSILESVSEMADHVGQQLGNYRLVRLLGRGGFAEVYLGEHRYLKRFAALKVHRASLTDEEAKRFLSEAQTLAQLTHPYIVRVLEFAVEQGAPVLVMDHAPGGTLRQLHPHGSRLPLATVVSYVKQVAAALQYAHNHNIIHRDVKPENILLGSDQHLLLSDFGLALLAPSAELLSTQLMAGTLPYTAPEQLRGKPCFASDQYALGIATYEWLCGKRPFVGTQWEIIQQQLSTDPPSLHEICPELPAAVEEVVLKALAKDPQQRFASVQAFALALERASQSAISASNDDAEITASLKDGSHAPFSTPTDYSHFALEAAQKRVFLSAPSADEPFVTRLKADLEARGVLVLCAPSAKVSLSPDQQDRVRQAIRSAGITLVVASPNTRTSRTVKEHLRIAEMYQQRLVVVWAAGDELAAVLPESWGEWVVADLIDARKTRYAVALDEILNSLEERTPPAASLMEPSTAELLPEPRNPYKGLRPFTRNDATDFFGRDSLIQELVEMMQGTLASEHSNSSGPRLLTVIGPSGSGKSSVVMAGLLPQLQNGALPGSEEWVYLQPIVPGKRPIESLLLALSQQLPTRSLKSIYEDLADESARGLHLLATQLVKGPGAKVVLMIDQFEELFLQTLSEAERQLFIDLLITATTEPCGPVIILLTLRADFYDRPMQYPELSQLIETYHRVVHPMDWHDLRAVIEQPAALPDVQLTFEDNLIGDLVFEAQGQAGALPLLEFTLDQLFQQRNDHQLTLEAYQKIGGVKGALAKHAESTYTSLPSEEHRRLARALFLRLIDPGMTEQDSTRRRAALSEMSLPNSRETILIQEAASAFIAARLLTTNELNGVYTLEVSHEALIREWARLAEWLREAREDIRLQQNISEDVAAWQRRSRPKDRLYRGSQLKEARMWAKRNTPSRQEAAFLRTSIADRRRFVVSTIAILLLLPLMAGVAGWLFSLLSPPPPTTTVTTLKDDGPGSLRQVIHAAKSGSTIRFAPDLQGETINLTSGNLDIDTKDLTIRGLGASTLTISGGNSGHYIHVLQGASVTVSGLSFKDSKTDNNANSGFISNDGVLILTNTIVSDNSSASIGGGITNLGTLSLTNSTVSGNSAASIGGGIFSRGTLSLTNSTVSGNKSSGSGGGDGSGGGIYNFGKLSLTNSTISGNSASDSGGGITFFSSQATINFSTIYGNTAHDGGGIFVDPSNPSTVGMSNSIVAGNHAATRQDIAGTLTSNGYNLIQDNSGAAFTNANSTSTDLIGMSPNVGPLHNNGGSTETHALLTGSPAIDKIPRDKCNVPTDQRRVKRPQGSACDIGAYEYQAVP